MPEHVLLLHGLLMRRPAMMPLARRLRARGFEVSIFSYATLFQPPSRAMERLALRLYAHRDGPMHLVAHSLGGLVAVETLNRYQALPPGRLVCLGSPLAGSAAARGLKARGLGFVSGHSGALLRGGLITLPGQREIGVIAGSRAVGMGRFFGQLEGPNDGTVAVWETRLPGLSGHVVVPASHSGLTFSSQVADLTAAYLKTGRFPA